MRGWKTWLSSAGRCGLWVYLIEKGNTETGLVCIFNGLGRVGIGSKIDRGSK